MTIPFQTLGLVLPPTQRDLPCDDGEPMETQRHKAQMDLLIDAIEVWLKGREDGYVGGNMFVYYSLAQVKNQDFKGPDVFVVLGVPKGERRSWVCWEEGKTPDVVIELLSESTAEFDKTTKKQLYQDRLHVPEYFWFDPFNPNDRAGFQLQGGTYYPIEAGPNGELVSQVLNLALVLWTGTYKGIETTWLRWTDRDGFLLPTAQEDAYSQAVQAQQAAEQERQRAEQAQRQAEQERQRAEQAQRQAEQERQRAEQAQRQAEQERQRAEQERQRAERLAAQLRAMGIDPNTL
ncbi:Uma2 family endonuclease [Trichothermofontia sichuanensis B231]|uniref:Uma2 family endonuclease n=1 Tax=Trichothermofontia sichuanensis TaxID=3045816 RepID=UPI0022458B43|nr:Uma2 family endonuclease [Trichothermofontia sichuanensis]UZQ52952.1 Uma2 family endonuclease [Trichothermofontia sichuanensis B231]